MIKTIWQRLFRYLFTALILASVLLYLLASYVEQQIFSPPRKQLHSFHLERLNNPAEFGLRIRQHQCLGGKVPCSLVEPDANAGPGKRGQVLRKQLAAKGVKLAAYGQVHGTLVLLHGRNGRKESLLPVAERFVAAGFRCIIPDLPNHGDSQIDRLSFGSAATEQQLPLQVLTEVKRHFGLPDDPAALWGMSMGGAFAASAAHDQSPWTGVIIVSSFAALDEVLINYLSAPYLDYAEVIITLLDGVRWLQGKPTLSSIRPEHWAASIKMPALVVHGDRDYYVPMKQGQRLFAAINTADKQWLTVPDGGHRNVLATPMQLYAAMSEWLLLRSDLPH